MGGQDARLEEGAAPDPRYEPLGGGWGLSGLHYPCLSASMGGDISQIGISMRVFRPQSGLCVRDPCPRVLRETDRSIAVQGTVPIVHCVHIGCGEVDGHPEIAWGQPESGLRQHRSDLAVNSNNHVQVHHLISPRSDDGPRHLRAVTLHTVLVRPMPWQSHSSPWSTNAVSSPRLDSDANNTPTYVAEDLIRPIRSRHTLSTLCLWDQEPAGGRSV